jgi:hypothetical protein
LAGVECKKVPGTSFYRSAAGAEIDLVIELPGHRKSWALEIKRGRSPKLERGFHHAREDLDPERCLVVCGTDTAFPMGDGIEAMSLSETPGCGKADAHRACTRTKSLSVQEFWSQVRSLWGEWCGLETEAEIFRTADLLIRVFLLN